MGIILQVDSANISGPKMDGGFVLRLELGEYVKKELSQLMERDLKLPFTVEIIFPEETE